MSATRASLDVARRRLVSQRLTGASFAEPRQVVEWLGAVQAQDYAGAKWGLGQRLAKATDDDIERAFNAGEILRTHLLRPTWHFVSPSDIRWLLLLTAPRVHAVNASMYRKLGIDIALATRSTKALTRALRGGNTLTRDELRVVLERAGVATSGELRMSYIMMHTELDAVVCSGPRRGKQFTYTLLDERVPTSRSLGKAEALSELAGRYFRSRGPATVHDLAKWSGLTVTDCRSALDGVKDTLEREVRDGKDYWFAVSRTPAKLPSATAHLLSIYDEYVSGYRDRSAIVRADHGKRLIAMGNALTGIVVVDGQIVGTWKREVNKDSVLVRSEQFTRLTATQRSALADAGERYSNFLGTRVMMMQQQ